MFRLRWFRARGINRGKPGLPGGHGRRLMALGLLLAGCLLQTGCQSGPFSPCGFVGRTTSFLTRPFRHGCSSCGSEVVADGGCFPSGVPVGVGAAPVVVPGGTVIPGGTTPSNVQDSPTNLEAVPQASPGSSPVRSYPSNTGSTSTKGKTSSYETQRGDPRIYGYTGSSVARSLTSTPVPATRSAQESAQRLASSSRDELPAEAAEVTGSASSMLDHLPPLDLPGDVTERTVTPPPAPAAPRTLPPTRPAATPAAARPTAPPPAPAPSAASSPENHAASGRPESEPDPAVTEAGLPGAEVSRSTSGAPGIRRFVAVDLKLAAGSAPTPAGLDWLSEKGYKTLVDLRPSSETDLAFIAETARRGLRYVALPVDRTTLDRAHVARFDLEVAMGEARPLYFFDSDGTRAGALWYIRRIAVDRVSNEIARREAESLGLKNEEYWTAARQYLEHLEQERTQARRESTTSTDPAPPPSATASPDRAASNEQTRPSHAALVPPLSASASRSLLSSHLPTPSYPAPVQSTGWQPYAAILATGVGLPLALWGRSAVPVILTRTLASLPAPARRSRALPRALDA